MILLLNTSTPLCRLGIRSSDSNKTVWHEWQADRQLARGLLKYIRDTVQQAGGEIKDIEAVVVFQGPGSFTGLRIGITVVNTLANGLGIPIVGATNDDWDQQGIARITRGETDIIVLPYYGSEAHITKPRK